MIAAFKGRLPVAKVGVLGDGKNHRTEDGAPTNAQIGAWNEFGTSRMKMRSWLRMPISLKLQSALQEAGAFDNATLKKVIEEGSLTPFVAKIGIVGEAVVLGGFDTSGYGYWPASDMTKKENQQTLVETQQLRNAVASEVTE